MVQASSSPTGGFSPLGLSGHEWGIIAGFLALLLGISFISEKLAATIGAAALVVLAAQGILGGKLLNG